MVCEVTGLQGCKVNTCKSVLYQRGVSERSFSKRLAVQRPLLVMDIFH